MSRRKSSRSKKSIDYARLGSDNDSDDDFAAPMSSTNKQSNQSTSKARLPEREKIKFKSDVDLAIKLSLDSCDKTKKTKKKTDQEIVKESSASICEVQDQLIELPSEDTKRASSNHESSHSDGDSFKGFSSESSESDDNESDFEIEVKPKKPKKATVQKEKPQRITNKVPKKSLPPTTLPPVQIKSQNKIASKRILTEKNQNHPSRTSFTPSKGIKRTSWTPPARAGTPSQVNSTISSPTTLRLGLSRNVRLKPLHSSVKTK